MTQKSTLFKGQQKKKSAPPSRHGKICHTRKGKRVVKPSKMTKEMDADRGRCLVTMVKSRDVKCKCIGLNPENCHLCYTAEGMYPVLSSQDHAMDLTKFINYCNEVKVATAANKEGGQLSIVKTAPESSNASKK